MLKISRQLPNLILFAIGLLLATYGRAQCDPSVELVCPAFINLNCGDDISPANTGFPSLTYNGDCIPEPELNFSDSEEGDDCLLIIYREWTATVTGLEFASCTQIISVEDNQPPIFEELPDDIVIECGGELPDAPDCLASDDCSGLASCETFVANTSVITETCDFSVPEGPGEDWSLYLPGLIDGQDYFVIDQNAEQIADYTIDSLGIWIVDHVATDNPNLSFRMEIVLENPYTWDEWFDLGRWYKDELGLAGDNYQDWTYWEMKNEYSRLIGQGDLEGVELFLSHSPNTYFYGIQSGMAANGRNVNNGVSGWFTYWGYDNGEIVSGHGDLAFDQSCTEVNEVECENENGAIYFRRAEDNCGNLAIDSQIIIGLDDTAPVFVDFPGDVTVTCDNVPDPSESIEAIDECTDEVEIIGPFEEIFPGVCPVAYTIERSWDAVDACGNSERQVQVITVLDEGGPVFVNTEAEIELECGESFDQIFAEAIDDCTEILEIEFSDEIAGEGCVGVIRTYTATDLCGNTSTFEQTILFSDEEDPVFTSFPADTAVSCDEVPDILDPSIQAEDDCSGVSIEMTSIDFDEGPCVYSYTEIRTYTATDGCGNQVTQVWVIDIVDDEGPEILGVPEDQVLSCGEFVAPAEVFAQDACDEFPTISLEATTEPLECGEQFIRTWTATDACGNITTATSVVTFTDDAAPTALFTPSDLNLNCSEEVPFEEPLFEDDCSSFEVSFDEILSPGACQGSYTILRTWTALDGCGNSTAVEQVIVVSDEEGPVFLDFEPEIDVDCTDFENIPEVSAEDACGTTEITFDDAPLEGDEGILRTWIAIDDCGNVTEADQIIYIVDNEGPVFTVFPEDISASCDDVPLLNEDLFELTDNCGLILDVAISEEIIPGDCPHSYTLIYTIAATDFSGNVTEQEWTIEVSDNIAPDLLGVPADIEIGCLDPIPDAVVFAQDNCDDSPLVSLEAVTEVLDCGELFIRTWTGTDACGNTTVASQTVTIVDDTDPYFLELPPETIELECGEEIPPPFEMTVLDDCDDEPFFFYTEEIVGEDCPQTITRIWRGYDCAGNETIFAQEVIIGEEGPGLTDDEIAFHQFSMNPATAEINFQLYSEESGRLRVEMINMQGQRVKHVFEGYVQKDQSFPINIQGGDLGFGIYVIRAVNDVTVTTKTISILRK